MKEELKKRWSPELIDVNLFFKNAENKRKQFLFNTKSKNYKKLDLKRFLERVIRMKKALEKKDKMQQQREIDSNFYRNNFFLK